MESWGLTHSDTQAFLYAFNPQRSISKETGLLSSGSANGETTVLSVRNTLLPGGRGKLSLSNTLSLSRRCCLRKLHVLPPRAELWDGRPDFCASCVDVNVQSLLHVNMY